MAKKKHGWGKGYRRREHDRQRDHLKLALGQLRKENRTMQDDTKITPIPANSRRAGQALQDGREINRLQHLATLYQNSYHAEVTAHRQLRRETDVLIQDQEYAQQAAARQGFLTGFVIGVFLPLGIILGYWLF